MYVSTFAEKYVRNLPLFNLSSGSGQAYTFYNQGFKHVKELNFENVISFGCLMYSYMQLTTVCLGLCTLLFFSHPVVRSHGFSVRMWS